MINTFDNPIYNLWYTNSSGEKVSVTKTNETYKIVNNKIFLTHIPDSLIKINYITINSTVIYEVPKGSIIDNNSFTVDYELGLIDVPSIYEGQTAIVNSYGAKGSILFPLSRIYDDQNLGNGNAIKTLDQLLDDITNNLNIAITNAETNLNNNIDTLYDSFTHLGEYDPLYSGYKKNNEVKYLGNSFVAIQDVPVGEYPSIIEDTIYWKKRASKGDSGSNTVSRGVYVAETNYNVNDLVIYLGNVYECIATSTGNLPTNTNYFRPFLTSTSISSYKNTYVIDGADKNTVPIGISAFNKDTDILYVYVNSTYIEVDEDYTIDATSENISKVSGIWIGNNTTTFNFIVLKNVNAAYYADGRLIEDGTISRSKLSVSLNVELVPTYSKINVLNYVENRETIYDGVTSAVNAINSALMDIPTGGTLYFPRLGDGIYLIDSDLNLTAYPNITLEFESGAKLNIADTKTLTGKNTKINAGLSQIFELNTNGIINGTWNVKEYYPQWFGAVGDGIHDDTSAIQFCINQKKPVYNPPGIYKITSTINLSQYDFYGSGDTTQFDIHGCHGFNIPLSSGRKVTHIHHFHVISSDNSCDNYAAFTSSQDINNTGNRGNGFKISHIEIGGGGRFGAGFMVYDMFRLNVSHIGMTHCLNAIIILGQVIQATFDDITANLDTTQTSTLLNGVRHGIYVAGSSHVGYYQSPESNKFTNVSCVGYDIGLNHKEGLYMEYTKLDLDYCCHIGAIFGSCQTGVSITHSWIAVCGSTQACYGIDISTATHDYQKLRIENNTIKGCSGMHADSVGIRVGTEVDNWYRKGITISGNKIHHTEPNKFKYGIYINRARNIVIDNNQITPGGASVKSIYIYSAENFVCTNNNCDTLRYDSISSPFTSFNNVATIERNAVSGKSYHNEPNFVQCLNKYFVISGTDTDYYKRYLKIDNHYIWSYGGRLRVKTGSAPTSNTDGYPYYEVRGTPTSGQVIRWNAEGYAEWTT